MCIRDSVKNAFRTLLTYGYWRDGVLIPFDDTEIFQLPAEHHLQGSVMQRSQIDGEPQGVSRCFRSVDANQMCIRDRVKVTRSALQNAASIAGLFLTTEAVVANKPEPPRCV